MEELSNPINKGAYLLLKQMFNNKMVQLESDAEKKETIAFERQLNLNKLQKKVELFIERNNHGKFELRVLEKNAKSIESYKYALVVKNYSFQGKDDGTLFIITIDSAFTEVTFYQMAINGVLLSL